MSNLIWFMVGFVFTSAFLAYFRFRSNKKAAAPTQPQWDNFVKEGTRYKGDIYQLNEAPKRLNVESLDVD